MSTPRKAPDDRGDRWRSLLLVVVLLPWPLLFSEHYWWAFIVGTAAIVGALRLVHGPHWTNYAGLKIPPVHILLTVVAFGLMAAATGLLLPHIYASGGLRAGSPELGRELGLMFQSLNEEILFRALLIGLLLQYAGSRVLISVVLACIFAAAHFLLYRFSNPLHVPLSPIALSTLFLAGVAMNNLYLAFRHIGFSWAFHAGWNVVWLSPPMYDTLTNVPLHEPQVFNRVLGAPAMTAIAGAATLVSFALLAWRPRGGSPLPTGHSSLH